MLPLTSANLIVLPGDVFLTRSSTLLGKLIRAFQRSPGEARSVVNHVGLFARGGPLVTAQSIEALWHTRLGHFWHFYRLDNTRVAIYRHTGLSAIQRARVANHAVRTYRGTRYGWWKLIFHALGWQRLLRYRKRPICSFLVGDSYDQVGVSFGKSGRALDPDDIWDHVTASPEWGSVLDLTPEQDW